MAVDAIGATTTANTSAVSSSATIGQDDFLRILLTQLRFQDPLKPVDNQQFVAQLAQFSALEINRQQSEKVDTLLTIEAANQALGLVGKNVTLGASWAYQAGNVTSVSFSSGEPLLNLSTAGVPISGVKLSDVTAVSPAR